MITCPLVLENCLGLFIIFIHTGDTVTLVTTYPTQHKTSTRYTLCPQCQQELYSPFHGMYHHIWEKQQIAKQSNVRVIGDEKSIVVESEWNGKRYRGVMYPVEEEKQ